METERCKGCGRIPFYCNCEKKEIVDSEIYGYDKIEEKLSTKGLIGQASFIQSEKNANGKIETYWINLWLKESNIPCLFSSDQKHYKTKLAAMNGILNNI